MHKPTPKGWASNLTLPGQTQAQEHSYDSTCYCQL